MNGRIPSFAIPEAYSQRRCAEVTSGFVVLQHQRHSPSAVVQKRRRGTAPFGCTPGHISQPMHAKYPYGALRMHSRTHLTANARQISIRRLWRNFHIPLNVTSSWGRLLNISHKYAVHDQKCRQMRGIKYEVQKTFYMENTKRGNFR